MKGDYRYQRKQKHIIVLITLIVSLYLMCVISYDAFIAVPRKTEKIEFVLNKFGELKTYVEAKLPEIDSALIKHAKQIDEQTDVWQK